MLLVDFAERKWQGGHPPPSQALHASLGAAPVRALPQICVVIMERSLVEESKKGRKGSQRRALIVE